MRAATTATQQSDSQLSARSPTSRPLATSKRTWRQWLREFRVPAAIGILILMVVAILSYLNATYVSGVELNCKTWQLRKFSFRRDPFTNHQLTAVYHDAPYAVGPWTVAAGANIALPDATISVLLGNRPTAQTRWDLVRLQETNSRLGPAEILVELMGSYDRSYNLYWVQWTADNPALAKILWPAAQDLTVFERYTDLPELLRLARTDLDPAEFKTAVGVFLQNSLREFAAGPGIPLEQAQAANAAALSYGPSEVP